MRANAVNGIGLLAPISKLTPLQAVLLREIWHSGEALYASLHRARYAAATGVAEVSKVDVQGRPQTPRTAWPRVPRRRRPLSPRFDQPRPAVRARSTRAECHAHAQPRREPRAAVVEPSAQALRIS
ncbi:MAG: hypothetical protein WDN30_03125 [Pararobbsia sp.]